MPPPLPVPTYPVGTKNFCKLAVSVVGKSYQWQGDFLPWNPGLPPYQFGDIVNDAISIVNGSYDEAGILTGTVTYIRSQRHLNLVEDNPGAYNWEIYSSGTAIIPSDPKPNRVNNLYGDFEIREIGGDAIELKGNEQKMYDYLKGRFRQQRYNVSPCGYWGFCQLASSHSFIIASSTCVPLKFKTPRLPNQPTKIKPMDCCKEIKEIHKYLGIAKMKKDKFKVAKAFMVAGGTGNQECEDYYQVTQSLFRMLANGLIINPISKPLGNEWQNVNATTWAAQVYEMVAESMSDGNSSQKFEIGTIMQLAQLMSTIAELTRKVEFIVDVLGYEPILDTEDVPIAFTIHESHKGFAKYQPIKIDISKAKSDDDVEAVLTKLLQPSKIPIVVWQFNPTDVSINKTLRAL